MRFFQIISTDPEAEAYRPAEDNILEWVAEMQRRGILLEGNRLQPSDTAKLVRKRGGKLLLTDGPFAETKEWIAGYGILECKDQAEAIEVSSRHPMARFGKIEVREFWPFGDPNEPLKQPPKDTNLFLLFICSDPTGEDSNDPVSDWATSMDAAGLRVRGERLRPVKEAVTVKKRGGEVLVTDGPFAETKEWIAGYDLISAKTIDQAVACASKHPMAQEGRIEVRGIV